MLSDNFIVWSVYMFYLLLGLFAGAALGSGIMCLLMRRANGEPWSQGRSHCDSCGATLRWKDLFPIISYITSKGRCRYCGAQIPVSCLLAEVAFGSAGAALVLDFAIPEIPVACKFIVSILALVSVATCTTRHKSQRDRKEGRKCP